jgi:hypothetical protein
MIVLTTNLTTLDRLVLKESRNSSSIKLAQSMSSRQICLCCSNALLRHIHLGKVYWRCNHCYQAMPVIEDAKELLLFVAYGTTISAIVDFRRFPTGTAKLETEGCERSIPNLTVTSMMIHFS